MLLSELLSEIARRAPTVEQVERARILHNAYTLLRNPEHFSDADRPIRHNEVVTFLGRHTESGKSLDQVAADAITASVQRVDIVSAAENERVQILASAGKELSVNDGTLELALQASKEKENASLAELDAAEQAHLETELLSRLIELS